MPAPLCLTSLLRPLFSDLFPLLFFLLNVFPRSVPLSNAVLSSMYINAHFYDDIKYDYSPFSRAAEYLAGFFHPASNVTVTRTFMDGCKRLEANSNDAFWMRVPEELFTGKRENSRKSYTTFFRTSL